MVIISGLNIVALLLSLMDALLQVSLLEAELVLNVMTSISEDNDASGLDTEVSEDTKGISSEEGDGGCDHVSTEEGSGVNHELLGVSGSVPGKDNGSDGLENELSPGGSVVGGEESPGD